MESKKWVVLLTNLFGSTGGIPSFNRELVEALREIAHERGWTLKVYALNDSEDQRSPSNDYAYQGFRGHRWRFVRESLKAAWKADHVLFGHVHLSPLALLMPGQRRWLVAHGIEVWRRLSCLRRLGLDRMDRILCVSRFTRDRLMKRHHVKEERTVLFPNTARVSAPVVIPAIAAVAGIQSIFDGLGPGFHRGDVKIIFTLSRLWPEERYKNIDRVIEAMPSVLKVVPDALYVIAGDGGDRPRLERLALELGVQKQVVFMGALPEDQVKACYERCDVFILPSLGEGFGIVFLEAMACGKPCIGADAGAIPEVIQDGHTGLLVKPDSSEDIAQALIRLLQDTSLRQSMGRAGRERFVADYAVDRFRERLAAMMEFA